MWDCERGCSQSHRDATIGIAFARTAAHTKTQPRDPNAQAQNCCSQNPSTSRIRRQSEATHSQSYLGLEKKSQVGRFFSRYPRRDMAGFRGIPRDTAGYWEIPGDTRYGEIPVDTGRDTGRYGQMRDCTSGAAANELAQCVSIDPSSAASTSRHVFACVSRASREKNWRRNWQTRPGTRHASRALCAN